MAHITELSLRAMLGRGKGLPNPFPLSVDDKLTPAAADFLKQRNIGLVRPRQDDRDRVRDLTVHPLIPVGVSGRHVHLSAEHITALFGAGHKLRPLRELSQKGQYAAQETVTIVGPKGKIPDVRILGPSRGATQVEISRTDGYRLGVNPLVRLSGDIQDTHGIILVSHTGSTIEIKEGLIVARNHVHLSPDDAKLLHVAQGDRLILQTQSERLLIFADVIARISPHYSLDFHIDTDEANAAHLDTGHTVRLIGINGNIKDSVEGELS